MCDSGASPKITAYKLEMVDGNNFCVFRTIDECLDYLKEELSYCDDYSYIVSPYGTTEEEIAALPDFDGDFS